MTDANLLLGRLSAEWFFDGRMTVDVDRARRTAAGLARSFGIGVEELAENVVRVANANMERAIRVVSLERGHDPRGFALLAFGGAGGMHACAIADHLEIPVVVVPRHAGVLSALGMLIADVSKDSSASVLRPADRVSMAELARMCARLERVSRAELAREGFGPRRQHVQRSVDVRYAGQSHELNVPLGPSFRRAFDALHERRYGYADPHRPAEIVCVRVLAQGMTNPPRLPFRRVRGRRTAKPIAVKTGRFDGRTVRVAHHQWDQLDAGMQGAGPAVITSGEATAVVPPGFNFHIDGFQNVIARRRR